MDVQPQVAQEAPLHHGDVHPQAEGLQPMTKEGTLEGLGMMILDFRTHWRKLVAHSGEKPIPVIGAHSAVASTVEKNQTNLLFRQAI